VRLPEGTPRTRGVPEVFETAELSMLPEHVLHEHDSIGAAMAAIAGLPPAQRAVITMRTRDATPTRCAPPSSCPRATSRSSCSAPGRARAALVTHLDG